ncbi:hypothetical protein [Thomasclavelia ramosa]|uniref:hypothetical protein n=1 Tax=Thomasclavelia ramosa TaxID=1547 RepID=UPI003DA54AD8
MTVIVETTSLAEEIVFRDIVRIEDKEEWIVLNDKNGRCLPMPKQGIENIKVLDILTKIIDDDEAAV